MVGVVGADGSDAAFAFAAIDDVAGFALLNEDRAVAVLDGCVVRVFAADDGALYSK